MMWRISLSVIFVVFSISFAHAQNNPDNEVKPSNHCTIAEIHKQDLINDKAFGAFLKPYLGCLLPTMTFNFDKENGSAIVVSLPDDTHMTVYISDLRLTLLQIKREERAKKAEAFFHRAFFKLLGEEKNVSLNDVIPVIRSTKQLNKIKNLLTLPEKEGVAKSKHSSAIPYEEIADGISQAYIIDHDDIISYVSNYDMASWNISAHELQQKALDNLRHRIAQNPIHYEKSSYLTYVVIDNYFDSSLAVVPEIWDELTKQGNGQRLVVAFYSYDNVFYTYENDAKGIQLMNLLVKGLISGDNFISDKLYVWDNGKWSIFK